MGSTACPKDALMAAASLQPQVERVIFVLAALTSTWKGAAAEATSAEETTFWCWQ